MALQKAGWGANFIENHDQPRALSKLVKEKYQTPEAALGIGSLYFFLRGTPFIYQGQELGMLNFKRETIDEFDDISSIDNYHRSIAEGFLKEEAMYFVNQRSRDNSRTPMPWDNTEYGNFSTHKPWLEMTETYPKINAINNPVFKGYQQMIALRQESDIKDLLTFGDITFLDNLPETVIGYKRVLEGHEVYQLTNLSDKAIDVTLEKTINKLYFNSHQDFSNDLTNYHLKPYQSVLFTY